MKRIALIGSAIVIAIVLVILLVISSGLDRYRPQIQAQIQQKLNRPVNLGHLSLRLLPLSLRVDSLTVQDDPAFRSPRPFASANQVYVSVGFFSLLTGSPSIKSLKLDAPKIELIRNAAGVWNYSTLGQKETNAKSDSNLSLAELTIDDGQIGYTDELHKEARSVYNHIDVNLKGFAPNREFSLDLGAHLAGEGKQTLKFAGKVGPINSQNTAATPVKGHLTADGLTLSTFNTFAPNSIPQGYDAVATGEADITSASQNLLCKGSLKLDNAVVQGAKLDFPISARYDLEADRTHNAINIKSSSIGLGQTSFDLNGMVNAESSPAPINVHLVTKHSSISEIARLASTFHLLSNTSYQMKGTLDADLKASGTTSAPVLNGKVNAESLEVSGGEIQQPVRVPSLQLALTPQQIRSEPFKAQSGSTAIGVQFALANYSSKASTIDANLKTENANIAELLNIAKAYGLDSAQGAKGAGTLTLNIHVQGPTANPSALAFAGNAAVRSATLELASLTKPVAVRTADIQFSQNTAALSNLASTVGSTNLTGSLSVKNFATPDLQFALNADKLDTTELQHLTKSSAGNAPKSGPASGQPSLLSKTTGSGTIAAGTIKAEDIVLTNFKATCKLDRGLIHLSPMTTDLFGGKETGSITLDTRPADAAVNINAKLSGVDTNAALSAVSSVKNTLTGSLASDANLTFTLLNSSPALARTLNGTLSFNVTNGQLKNVNILNEISKVGKFLNAAPSQNKSGNNTDLKRLAGTLNIRNGVASTNNLEAVLDAGSMSGDGTLSLIDQALNMHVNAVLGQSVSQAVGGNGVGGYLNTALANNKGELVVPVIVSGTTSHPVFTPDVQSLAKMKLNNLLPTSGDPSKLTSNIIGAVGKKGGAGSVVNQILGGGNKNGADDQNNKENKENNPVNSILQQFGRKKPKQ